MGADAEAVQSVLTAIDLVLEKAQAEHAGLKRRLDEVTSRAAIVAGNDLDDHLTRTADRSQMLDSLDVEIRYAEERLKTVDQNISHFKFFKTAIYPRFPDAKP
jgi:hypothetical protein